MTTPSLTPSTASSKDAQRLFIAAPLPDWLKRTLGAWTKQLRPSLPFRKWTDEADLHVTLQFLGDTDPVRIPQLKSALASAAGSGRIPPFTLTLAGTGTFGRTEQPRVLWAGICGEVDRLRLLQRMIVETTAPLGFQAEARPFSPHLTVARSYTGKEAFIRPELPHAGESNGTPTNGGSDRNAQDIPRLQHGGNEDPLSWQVDEIVLYRTHMHRRPMYEAAARFELR